MESEANDLQGADSRLLAGSTMAGWLEAMIYTSLHGRLGKDAQEIQTKSGKPMAAANIAVNAGGREADLTLWVRVVAFGKLAELLTRHGKGDSLAASGRLELQHWTGGDGTERESWQLIADALHSARTVRGGGNSAKGGGQARATEGGAPFDDALPF